MKYTKNEKGKRPSDLDAYWYQTVYQKKNKGSNY